jgi:hypothetical protein
MNDEIFVFGSNLKGIHGAGAALAAKRKYGAIYGQGEGRTGMAYAIPTKKTPYESLTIEQIGNYVEIFIAYSIQHPLLNLIVTRIGCGLAGYKDAEIAPLFTGSPQNVILPIEWRPFLGEEYQYHDRSSDPRKIK